MMTQRLPSLRLRICAGLLAVGAMAAPALPEPRPEGFCWVPIAQGTPGPEDLDSAWRMLGVTEFRIPGLPGPVYTPYNRKGVWTVTPDAQFVPLDTPFPQSFLDADNWVAEPDRILAAPVHNGGTLWELRSDGVGFRPVTALPDGTVSLFRLDRLSLTLVQTCTADCTIHRVDGARLVPWLSPREQELLGGAAVSQMVDAPEIDAALLLAGTGRVSRHTVFAKRPGSALARLADLGGGRPSNVTPSGTDGVTLASAQRALRVRLVETGLAVSLVEFPKGDRVHGPFLDGHYIRLKPATWRQSAEVLHLPPDASDWVPLPGAEAHTDSLEAWRILPAPINRVLIEVGDTVLLYDGRRADPVTKDGQPWSKTGHALVLSPSLGRVLAFGPDTIEEITGQGRVREFGTAPEGLAPFSARDVPGLGAVTFRANERLHGLWPNGDVTLLRESDVAELDPSAPPPRLDQAPWSGVAVLPRDNRLWLRIDLARTHAPRCPENG